MLKNTAIGRFGENSFVHVATGQPSAFAAICERLGIDDRPRALVALGGPTFAPAQVALVVSTPEVADHGPPWDERVGESDVFVAVLVSDEDEHHDDDDEPDQVDDTVHSGGDREEEAGAGTDTTRSVSVELDDLFQATASVLPGRRRFAHHGRLEVDTEHAELEISLPMSLWHEKRPFGTLIGARFELDVRGARDGWIALDTREGYALVHIAFESDYEIASSILNRAWEKLRRIYDGAVVPVGNATAEDK